MTETSARPRSYTRRVDTHPRQRTATAQRAIDRRNRRIARSMVSTGAAVRNGSATGVPSSLTRGRSRASIKAQMNQQSGMRRLRLGKLSFVSAILIVCFVGLGISLVLSSYAASQSETLVALQHQNKELKERDAQLTKQLQESMSASQLAEKAAAMGMVPSGDVATLHKVGSKVELLGTPMAANGRSLHNINPPLPQRVELQVEEVSDLPIEEVKFEKRRTSDRAAEGTRHRTRTERASASPRDASPSRIATRERVSVRD